MFISFTIKQRISIMIGITICAQLIISGVIFLKMRTIEQHVGVISEGSINSIAPLTQITLMHSKQAVTLTRLQDLTGATRDDTTASNKNDTTELLSSYQTLGNNITSRISDALTYLTAAKSHAVNDSERQALETLVEQVTRLSEDHQTLLTHDKVLTTAIRDNKKIDTPQWEKQSTLAENINLLTYKILADLEQHISKDLRSVKTETQNLEQLTVLISLLVAGLIGAIGVATRRGINDGIEHIHQVFGRLAGGDFKRPIPYQEAVGEIGQLLKQAETMRNQVAAMLVRVGQAASDLTSAAQNLTGINHRVTSDTTLQGKEIDQMCASINQLSLAATDVATNASETHTLNEAIVVNAIKTQEVNTEVTQYIVDFIDSMKLTADSVIALEENTDSVGAVLDAIRGIAEQTNLLALNAAIEAARAGEQGRGFAVVADEVRTLAQRTQESTEEIATMMNQFRTSTHEAVAGMDMSRTWGEKMATKAKESQALMAEVQSAVSAINDMTLQIASAANEQSATSDEINRNMTRINQSSSNNQAEIGESVQMSENILALANQLAQSINQFEVPK